MSSPDGAPRPARVRVTGPDRRHRPRPPVRDLDDDTPLGGLYLGSLLRAQRRLALRVLAALGVSVGVWPLAFWLAPGLAEVQVLGAPLAWLLLGGLVYPWLVFLGWRYVRAAERTELDFADLVGEVER